MNNEMLDTKFFSIKRVAEGNGVVNVDGMVVDYSSGEEMHENRVYKYESGFVYMMMISKLKQESIFVTVSIVDEQNNKLMTDDIGWFAVSVYGELIKKLEEILFSSRFCIDKIVPGRLYNVYFQMQNRKDN
jgi:hypothetical protein